SRLVERPVADQPCHHRRRIRAAVHARIRRGGVGLCGVGRGGVERGVGGRSVGNRGGRDRGGGGRGGWHAADRDAAAGAHRLSGCSVGRAVGVCCHRRVRSPSIDLGGSVVVTTTGSQRCRQE